LFNLGFVSGARQNPREALNVTKKESNLSEKLYPGAWAVGSQLLSYHTLGAAISIPHRNGYAGEAAVGTMGDHLRPTGLCYSFESGRSSQWY